MTSIIHVYWSPPTKGTIPTGYEITYFAGAEGTIGAEVSVSGGSTSSHEISNLSPTVTYRVSIVSVSGTTRSNTTGPVLAARGEVRSISRASSSGVIGPSYIGYSQEHAPESQTSSL